MGCGGGSQRGGSRSLELGEALLQVRLKSYPRLHWKLRFSDKY
jgi:hypothetical protein